MTAAPRQQTTPQPPEITSEPVETASRMRQAGKIPSPLFTACQILALTALGMAALLALFPPVGHDQLWCLYVAQRMLAGARLYGPELFESNPPLIMWASLALASVSQATNIAVTILLKLAVCLIEVASAWASLRILQRIYPQLDGRIGRTSRWFLAFAFLSLFAVMPARDLGQRDHLLALLCLPYVLAAALDATGGRFASTAPLGPWARILIGLAAGMGICLKPHHALLVLTTELLVVLFAFRTWPRRTIRQHLVRTELATLVTTGLAYLIAVRKLTPEYLDQVVPLLREVYWAIGHLSPLALLGEASQLHLLLAITIAAIVLRGWRRVGRPVFFLLAAGFASTVAYYLQGTGWYYQQLPALSFTACALVLLGLETCLAAPVPTGTPEPVVHALNSPILPRATLALGILALALTAHFTGYPFLPSHSFPIDAPDEAFFRNLAPGTPVAILTTSVDDTVMPVAKYHLLWAQRTNNLWILPAILRNQSGPTPGHIIPPRRLAALDQLQHAFMAEDLARWRPTLILVDRCQDPKVQCQVIEDRHDDLLAWFERDPAFRSVFANYRYTGSRGDFDAYVLTTP
jgi:hypothetical protein